MSTGSAAAPSRQARTTRRRIFILPTAAGMLFGVTVFLMLLGSINYGLGLGYVLTFLLTGVGVVTMLLTYRNLAGLEVHAQDALPVFAGEEAKFGLDLVNRTQLPRHAVEVSVAPGVAVEGVRTVGWNDIDAAASRLCTIGMPARTRGTLMLPQLRMATTFPLGLFRAWSDLQLQAHCTVYPRPEVRTTAGPSSLAEAARARQQRQGSGDFAGLRGYLPGDAPAHVAWKAMARGAGLVTKQFVDGVDAQLWIRWSDLPSDMGIEAMLSRLARWILDAAQAGHCFGLDVPGYHREPGAGTAHVHACLAALAAFPLRS